jgi:hypothetical protein
VQLNFIKEIPGAKQIFNYLLAEHLNVIDFKSIVMGCVPFEC